jgi:hypothetical protein
MPNYGFGNLCGVESTVSRKLRERSRSEDEDCGRVNDSERMPDPGEEDAERLISSNVNRLESRTK